MNLWPESLQTVMEEKMKHGNSIHPHGIQLLAVRMLKVRLCFDAATPIIVCLVGICTVTLTTV